MASDTTGSITLLHTADLHLSQSEAEYGLAVLDELVAECNRLRPAAWLLCGDIFDTYADARRLAAEFRRRLDRLDGTPAIMIPGNHEALGADAGSVLEPEDFAPATLVTAQPLQMIPLPGHDVEIVAVPFRKSFEGYLDWPTPPREARWRVGMLHGVVNGMSYTGESAEAEQPIIDPHLLTHLHLDYAALGHIHRRSEQRHGDCLAHYPGSARVWRRGETGARQSSLVTLGATGVHVSALPSTAAGTYVTASLPVTAEGTIVDGAGLEAWLAALCGLTGGADQPADGSSAPVGPAAPEGPGRQDWVEIQLSGFVEHMESLRPLQAVLEREGAARFRRFDLDTAGVLEGRRMAGHPVAQAFDAQWRQRMHEAQRRNDPRAVELLLRARQLTLTLLQEQLDAL